MRRRAANREFHAWHDRVFCGELTRIAGVRGAERYEDTETAEHLALYWLEDPWITQQQRFANSWLAGWEPRRGDLTNWRRTLSMRIF